MASRFEVEGRFTLRDEATPAIRAVRQEMAGLRTDTASLAAGEAAAGAASATLINGLDAEKQVAVATRQAIDELEAELAQLRVAYDQAAISATDFVTKQRQIRSSIAELRAPTDQASASTTTLLGTFGKIGLGLFGFQTAKAAIIGLASSAKESADDVAVMTSQFDSLKASVADNVFPTISTIVSGLAAGLRQAADAASPVVSSIAGIASEAANAIPFISSLTANFTALAAAERTRAQAEIETDQIRQRMREAEKQRAKEAEDERKRAAESAQKDRDAEQAALVDIVEVLEAEAAARFKAEAARKREAEALAATGPVVTVYRDAVADVVVAEQAVADTALAAASGIATVASTATQAVAGLASIDTQARLTALGFDEMVAAGERALAIQAALAGGGSLGSGGTRIRFGSSARSTRGSRLTSAPGISGRVI